MDNPKIDSPQQEVFNRYIDAFSKADFEAITHDFSLPALLVSSGAAMSIDSSEKLAGLMKSLRASLPDDYDHTTLQNFTLYPFSENNAAAHITYTRCTKDDTVLSTDQGVYYFRKVEEQWLIYSVALLPAKE